MTPAGMKGASSVAIGASSRHTTAAASAPFGMPLDIVVCAIVGVTCVATILLVARPLAALSSTLTHLAFALPGILLVRAATDGKGGWLPATAFGPLVGFALSTVMLLGLWSLGLRRPWILVLAPALVCPLILIAPRMRGRWLPVTLQRSDLLCLGLLVAIVPILVARPFSLVGTMLPDGEVYRAYFTADYIWRRAVVVELAKGHMLPLNPFFLHDALHYYWLPHLLTGVEYRWLRSVVNVNELLLVSSVLTDIAFVVFLYGVARVFVKRPAAAAMGVACSILFSSFEGLYAMWEHWRIGASLRLLRNFNIDAVSRWLLEAMPIDGLQRVLWYQPHHALGYAIGILGLLIIARRVRRLDPWVFAIGGTLLGISTLLSSFGGLMLTSAAALHEAISVLRSRDWWRALTHLAAASIPLGLVVIIVVALQYVDAGGRIITLGLNDIAVRSLIPGTFLSFGPMLLIAGPGLWLAVRHHRDDFSALFALLAICVFFYFFVDIRDHQDVYVGWRVGHLTFIACAALTALTFDRLDYAAVTPRRVAWVGVLVVLLASAPTVVIDAYNTQDVTNRGTASGFRWTLVLSRDELEALSWIRTHTSPEAIFQVDPVVRDPDTWAYLPAFAERRMAVGLPISMVPLEKYIYESSRIRRIFDANAGEAYDRARNNGVQFILIGPPERAAHPGVESRFDAGPDLLPVAFRNGAISIYRVNGS